SECAAVRSLGCRAVRPNHLLTSDFPGVLAHSLASLPDYSVESTGESSMKVAAIDIGANSVHLVISRLHGPGAREILDREREIVIGEGSRVSHVKSLKLGVLRLAVQFPGRRAKTVEALEQHIRAMIGPVAREVAKAGVDAAVGTSGTIMALAELLDVRDEGHPIRLSQLEDLSRKLLKASPKELADLEPIGEN